MTAITEEHLVSADTWSSWSRLQALLLGIWLGVAALCALVSITRIVRFERLLRHTTPAPEWVARLGPDIASKLAVRRLPELRSLNCVDSPFVWCAGHRATIVLPEQRLREPDPRGLSLILAHELAHLRRRDHWVRGVELIVSVVCWWNPLVWLIRRQIHQSEDLCCDAWVRSGVPGLHATLRRNLARDSDVL